MKLVLVAALLILVGCGDSDKKTEKKSDGASDFKVYMADVASDDYQAVIVNVKQLEVWLSGNGKEARVILAANLGNVNLLEMRSGVLLPLDSFTIPKNLSVSHVRVVLEGQGHFAVRKDGSVCELRTPNDQVSAVRVKMDDPLQLLGGWDQSVLLDFDAKNSIQQVGANCEFNPKLALKATIRVDSTDSLVHALSPALQPEDMTIFLPVSSGEGFDFSQSSTWPSDISKSEIRRFF